MEDKVRQIDEIVPGTMTDRERGACAASMATVASLALMDSAIKYLRKKHGVNAQHHHILMIETLVSFTLLRCFDTITETELEPFHDSLDSLATVDEDATIQ